MRKRLAVFGVTAALVLAGCTSESKDVNNNLDKDADNFKVLRRVVFVNAITDKYILSVEGYCSVDPGNEQRMTVTCKVGNEYKRNALGKADNVFWFYEQLGTRNVSTSHYRVIFRPESIVPEAEVR